MRCSETVYSYVRDDWEFLKRGSCARGRDVRPVVVLCLLDSYVSGPARAGSGSVPGLFNAQTGLYV